MVFDWDDDIHFLGKQLDYYCGEDNWSWKLCADVVGVSTTTVRKYYNEPWELTQEEAEEVQRRFNEIDFSKNELKTLTYSDYRYILASRSQVRSFPLTEENNQENLKLNQKILEQELPTKRNLKESRSWPHYAGLYLLANVVSPPNRPYEKYYLLKVGKSIHLDNRINSYKGMNPFAVCIDIKTMLSKEIDEAEIEYHNRMFSKNWIPVANTAEWFVVPENDYKKVLKEGFNAL